jgi:hypothetical protein
MASGGHLNASLELLNLSQECIYLHILRCFLPHHLAKQLQATGHGSMPMGLQYLNSTLSHMQSVNRV